MCLWRQCLKLKAEARLQRPRHGSAHLSYRSCTGACAATWLLCACGEGLLLRQAPAGMLAVTGAAPAASPDHHCHLRIQRLAAIIQLRPVVLQQGHCTVASAAVLLPAAQLPAVQQPLIIGCNSEWEVC